MPSKVDDLVLRLEAVLFASGKPQSVRELTETLGVSDYRPVQNALKKLVRTYDGRQTALEVRRVGDRYALQLREAFVSGAQSVTPVDLAPRTLKTLTLIAYHQPIRQSLLARMLGEAAYEEVQRLRGLGLIHAEARGVTLELRTTKMFGEYFGISSNRPEEIRAFLERKLGAQPTRAAENPAEPAPVEAPPEETPAMPPGVLGAPAPPPSA